MALGNTCGINTVFLGLSEAFELGTAFMSGSASGVGLSVN